MEELAAVGGTLEIESIRVIDRVGQVTVAAETGWVNFLVAWVCLPFHTPQIITNFIDRAGHIAFGIPVTCRTAVIFPDVAIALFNFSKFHGYFTSRALRLKLF